MKKKVKVGVVGVGERGWQQCKIVCTCDNATLEAICDIDGEKLDKAQRLLEEKYGVSVKKYADYKKLIDLCDVIIVAPGWSAHTEICVDCLLRGKIPAVEVYGAYDVEECWELVRTVERTGVPFMYLENCCYDKFELICTALHRKGAFGKVVYCHGAYGHDLRHSVLNGGKWGHYRGLEYQLRNCENYPTHELGPIAKLLNINRGNKLLSLSSQASEGGAGLEEYAKREGKLLDEKMKGVKFKQGDVVMSTISTTGGELITLKLDTTLPRFYDREFTVRGTKGLALNTANFIRFDDEINPDESYNPVDTIKKYANTAERFIDLLPDEWRCVGEEEKKLGHNGVDHIQLHSFFDKVLNGEEMPVDVYDGAMMMAITPLSEQSIATGGMPQAIPDFTRGKWLRRKPLDVLKFNI